MIWSLACTGLAGVGFGFACASRTGAWAAGLGFAFSGLVSNLFNRLDSLNKTGWERGSRNEQGLRPRFPSAAMAACPSSLSSTGTALPASILDAKGMVRERRARGFNLGASRRGLLLKKEGATGGHGWRPASSWGALLGQREG